MDDGMMATVDPCYYLSCRPAALEAISEHTVSIVLTVLDYE